MPQAQQFQLTLPPPPRRADTGGAILTTSSPVVVIGANGSGKTRLGNWIEEKQPRTVHRVAAQKSLTFPDSITPPAIDKAHHNLLFGHDPNQQGQVWKHNRWGSHPSTGLLNDYHRLLEFLFAEEAERNAEFKRVAKATASRVVPPETKLDIVKRIWEQTLPERELIIGGGRVEARKRSSSAKVFNAAEMSDGERVIFYLIGQALSAPPSATIIIDEPELHLHKGIQTRLWNEIEAQRTDCLFVYLTHDLDFASSRICGTRIWIREFDGTAWDWEVIPQTTDIPEPLLLRVLGSRKSVLFVEGLSGSIDEEVYSQLFPEWTVTPCGSCEHVIHATGVYGAMKAFHHLECRGLIDDDERTAAEVSALQKAGIRLLGFSEIENIFLLEDVLLLAADKLLPGTDKNAVLTQAKAKVLSFLATDRERIISKRVVRRLQEAARYFQSKAVGAPAIEADWNALHTSIVPSAIHAAESKRIDAILAKGDYDAAIRVYPNKGLSQQITGLFGSINLQQFLRKLLAAPSGDDLRTIIRKHLPTIG